MNDGHRRRHIRDIAHLYLSGARQRDAATRVCLVMAGCTRGCFPGFHAANLAAALSIRGCQVRLHERSGVLPNAGFYLALPPSRYIPWGERGDEPGSGLPGLSGLSGVTVDFSPVAADSHRAEPPKTQVDLHHLPPWTGSNPAREVSAFGKDDPRPITVVLVVGGDGTGRAVPEEFLERLAPDAVVGFHTGGPRASAGGEERAVSNGGGSADDGGERGRRIRRLLPGIGSVTDWEVSLADRVPAVVRAPDSALARAYLAAADALRIKTDELRRTAVEPASTEGSAGLRSGGADRRPGREGTVLPIYRFSARHSR